MLPTRLFLTTMACAMLGAFAGRQNGSLALETSPPASAKPAPPIAQAASLPSSPPPFTSVTASMDWVRSQLAQGDSTAAELLFRQEAGLTPEQRLALAKELVRDFRRHDPRVLARIVLGLPRSHEADQLLWSLISTWSGEDAEGALHFIEALPANLLNTVGVLQNGAWGLCRLPAERVLAFAARLTDEGRSCLAEGLTTYADQAGAWRNSSAILAGLNAKPQKDVISAEWMMGRQLAEIDPQAFESLIAAEKDVVKRDELIAGHAAAVGDKDPVRAIELDMQIKRDEGMRNKCLQNHMCDWLCMDRTAALAWLQSDEARRILPAEERGRLLKIYGLEAGR